MPELRGLPGVKRQVIKRFVNAKSAAAVVSALRKCRFVTAADDNGGITVWRDDSGQLRAEFCRWRNPISVVELDSIAALKRWLREWWPKMKEYIPPALREAKANQAINKMLKDSDHA